MTYTITIKDETGAPIPGAQVYFLDGPNGNGLLENGVPAGFTVGDDGTHTWNGPQPPVYVRVQASGFLAKNATLQPGANEITVTGVNLANVSVEAARTFWNKYKAVILIIVALAMIWAAIRFKILSV